MKKLSIQLVRNGHSTTRRPRWVVWLLGAVVLFLGLLHLTSLWFTRSELLIAAPTGTEMVIEINLTPRTTKKISFLFKNIPLISNRSLELSDLLPYRKGKVAVFVLSDGTTAIALRTKKESLPTDLLDAHRVVVQDVAPNVVLLSEKLLSLSAIKKPWVRGRWLPNLLGKTIGTVYLPQQKAGGLLKLDDSSLSFDLQNVSFPVLNHHLPKDTYAFMSTRVLTNPVVNTFIDRSDQTEQLKKLFTSDSWIFLTNHEKSPGFVIWSETPEHFDRPAFIKQVSANLNPILENKQLKDGTITKEISIDPDGSSIEELTILGRTFLHSRSKKGEEFYLSSSEDLIFSNNEANVRSFLEGSDVEPKQICNSNTIALNFLPIIDTESQISTFYTQSSIRKLAKKFQSIGVKTHGTSSNITLCR